MRFCTSSQSNITVPLLLSSSLTCFATLPANTYTTQTPSLVPPHLLEAILQALQKQFGIAAGAEISLEADPGTFDLQRLLQYKALGVTRVSMGVQTFQEVGAGALNVDA
jgi:histone acetyltransferase (RNA polymerase elongator complex component)